MHAGDTTAACRLTLTIMPLTRRAFLQSTATMTMGLAVPALASRQDGATAASEVRIQLIRNATCRIRYAGRTLLLDPWLGDAGTMPAVNNSPNPRANPLVPLPVPAAQVVAGIDATLLTHTHFDHWDAVARELLPGNGTLFAQPADTARVTQAGFSDVRTVDVTLDWAGITLTRTGGQHGRGAVGTRMGAVSGYVLSRRGSPTVYIAGDTVWCPEVADAIGTHRPDVILVNAGDAQFLEGGPIIMGVADVLRVCEAAPRATIVAVHLEAVNHCLLTRDRLRASVGRPSTTTTVLIPRDGEDLRIA